MSFYYWGGGVGSFLPSVELCVLPGSCYLREQIIDFGESWLKVILSRNVFWNSLIIGRCNCFCGKK